MKSSVVFALAAFLCVVPLSASNLVLNAGFASGTFTSWNVALAPEGVTELIVSPPKNSGSFSAGFGATIVGSFDSIFAISEYGQWALLRVQLLRGE